MNRLYRPPWHVFSGYVYMGRGERRIGPGNRGGSHSIQRHNRFSAQEERYGLHYNSGHDRYGVKNTTGYAGGNRSRDSEWSDGRNTYWSEKYHHQGHPDEGSLMDRVKRAINNARYWFSGKKDKPQTGDSFDEFEY